MTGHRRNQLISQLKLMGIGLSNSQAKLLVRFGDELLKWNRAYNLTGAGNWDELQVAHLLDCLAVRPWLSGERVVDVGTGAGLPGLPLAIAEPEKEFALLDSNAKRTRFVTHCVVELGLANVEVVRSRSEDYRPTQAFDTVVTRAFATLGEYLSKAGHLCRDGGRVLAMKGRYPENELRELPADWDATVNRIEVPELNRERHIVVLERKQDL